MPAQLVTAVWVDIRTANRNGPLVGSISQSDVLELVQFGYLRRDDLHGSLLNGRCCSRRERAG